MNPTDKDTTMNASDELAETIHAQICEESLSDCLEYWGQCLKAADAILAAGYTKPRTITTFSELESLPTGSAVETSDPSDTVVLRGSDGLFRNQDGAELTPTDLWRFADHPLTALFSPVVAR